MLMITTIISSQHTINTLLLHRKPHTDHNIFFFFLLLHNTNFKRRRRHGRCSIICRRTGSQHKRRQGRTCTRSAHRPLRCPPLRSSSCCWTKSSTTSHQFTFFSFVVKEILFRFLGSATRSLINCRIKLPFHSRSFGTRKGIRNNSCFCQ